MTLPFTGEQFFNLFADYNGALWPGALALWIASAGCVFLLTASRRSSDRLICAVLAIQWAWSGLAYHVVFFTRINRAAWFFAALFLVQAALLIWEGVVQRRLQFSLRGSAWAPMAWMFIIYALVYPAMNAAQHHTLSRIPTFGVPCPTTIFTAGLLMLATRRTWLLSIIPILWSALGTSAAFSLGVTPDYALPVAAIALAMQKALPLSHKTRSEIQ